MAGSWFWEGTFDFAASWRALVDLSRLAHGVTYACLLLLILGGCLTTAVLALKGLPETACRDLVADRETGPISVGIGA